MLAGGRLKKPEFERPGVSDVCEEILECAFADDAEDFSDVEGHRQDDLCPVSFPVFDRGVVLCQLCAKGDRNTCDIFKA